MPLSSETSPGKQTKEQEEAETPEEESRLWRRTVMGRCGAFCLRQDNNLQMYSILTYVDLCAILLLLK